MPKSLCLLFNLIACKAHFPTKWKVAENVPICKDGDKQDASNYRPISLLPAVSKLLETLIFNKLIPEVYSTLNPAEHGFWPKRLTTTNLIEYLHEIISCLGSNPSYLTTFYIDFQKAFDKVSHDLLLDKLSELGIGGNCLSLLGSYLSNRKQTLRINSTTSKKNWCLYRRLPRFHSKPAVLPSLHNRFAILYYVKVFWLCGWLQDCRDQSCDAQHRCQKTVEVVRG